MKCFIVLVACVAASMAAAPFIDKCVDAKPYQVVRSTKRTGKNDDDRATVQCPPKYTITKCECESNPGDPDGCDGERIVERHDGYHCEAYNSASGKGVVAKVTCARIVTVCRTKFETHRPRIECPKNYQLISCALSSQHMHIAAKQGKIPKPIKKGRICKASAGCELAGPSGCQVIAVCIRKRKFFA